MSKSLSALKLTATRKPQSVNPVAYRRNKLCKLIAEQIALLNAQQDSTAYTSTHVRLVTDEQTGVRTAVTAYKRVKQWWYATDDRAIALSLRYGSKTLELAKGKWAVAVRNYDELVLALATLRDAVNAGELDAQIDAVAKTLRNGFAS